MRLKTILEDQEIGSIKKLALELQQLLLEMNHIELSVRVTTQADHTIVLSYNDESKLIQGNIKIQLVHTAADGSIKYRVKANNALILISKELPNAAFVLFKLFQGSHHTEWLHAELRSAFGTINVTQIDKFQLKEQVCGFVIDPPVSLNYIRDKAHMLHGNDITNLQLFVTQKSELRVHAYDADRQDHEFTISGSFAKDMILDVQKRLVALVSDAEAV